MVDLKSALWERIRDFTIDDPTAKLKFSARLARDNGWSPSYAKRVIEEYKKFIFLALEAGHEVTPSEQVDHAWHLHIIYTRSYWDELCGKVLDRPLHHGPTLGGAAENKRYKCAYAQTLTSYATIFGVYPPRDIWPPSAIRFGRDTRHRRVNTELNWVIPKQRAFRLGACVALLSLALFSIGAGPIVGGDVVAVVVVLAIIGVVLTFIAKAAKGNSGRSGCGGHGCSSSGCSGGGRCSGGGGCGGGCGGSGD